LPDKPSIAVLPFTNMSGDPSQEYFSDGITEDIITELSRFSELFVIARNSSFQFKGKSADIRQVGRELGWVLNYRGEHDPAIGEYEKAIALNPNYTDWRFAAALIFSGQTERAIELLRRHIRLDPLYTPNYAGWLGLAFHGAKRYSEALVPLRECVSRAPNFRAGHYWLAATYARLGLLHQARAEAAEVLRIQPDYTIEGTQKRISIYKFPYDAEHFFEGLRMAGLPEK
jgi:adenylate cyclase